MRNEVRLENMALSTQAGRAVGELSVDARSADQQRTRITVRPARAARYDMVLLALVALGAIVRVAYSIPYHVCFGDESCYLYLARNLFGGQGYTYYNNVPEIHFPPLFPIALGLLHHLVAPDWEIVSRVAYVVFGSLLLVPVYLLARRIYGVLMARIAAMILALLPAFTSGVLFAETLSEPLYLFCLAWGIYQLYVAFADGTLRSHVLTGVAFSLAYLTRPEAMLYFFLALGTLPIFWAIRRRHSFRQAAARLAVLAAGFFVVAFPYLVFVRLEVGTWTLSTKGRTTYLTTRALVPQDGKVDTASFLRDTWGLDEKGEVRYFAHEFDQRTPFLLLGPYRDRLLPDIQANLGLACHTLYRRAFLGEHLLALAVLGLVSSILWRRRSLYPEVFHLLLLTPLTAFLVFFIKERYFYPALIPLVLWMACGIEAVLSLIERGGRFRLLAAPWTRRALQAAVLCVTAVFLLRVGHQVYVKRSADQPDITALTQAIQRHTPEGAPVVCAYPQFAFHADRRWLPLPVASIEEICRYATLRGASCIAIADWRLSARPEEQQMLIDSPGDRPGLELLETSRGAQGPDFAIYRIRA